MPLVGFYWKHGSQINAMVGKTSGGGSPLLVEVVAAFVPVVKKHWPKLNENNLLDDALNTLREMTAPPDQTNLQS